MLPPIQGLKFYPGIHRYRYKKKWLINSVTGVISHDMTQAKKAAINYYKDGPRGWAARGTALHKVLENKLLNRRFKEDELWQEWVEPLTGCELFEKAETLAVEYSVCEEKFSLGGSFDFLIKTKEGETILGDLKTSSSKRAAKQRGTADEQLGAYFSMFSKHHPSLKIDKCCTVILGPGVCRVEKEEPQKCLEEWKQKWEKFQSTQEDW